MIQANELRIGNLVYVTVRPYEESRCMVKIEPSLLMILTGELKNDKFRIDPIPLSEEILLKCGFEKISEYIFSIEIDNGWHLNIESNYIFLKYQDNECEISHFKFEYIHQLQNLYFALTGTELNIEL